MRKTGLLAIAVLTLVCSAVYGQDATPEPGSMVFQSGADEGRSGIYNVEPLYEFSRVRWQLQIGPASLGNPIVANSTLYVGNQRGVLFALDTQTGETRWTRSGFGGHIARVVVTDGMVYATGDGRTLCFARGRRHSVVVDSTGWSRLWRSPAG
jgi:outer membrane protein assembly factor BamB